MGSLRQPSPERREPRTALLRGFLLVWLLLHVLAALDHTLIRGILPYKQQLSQVLPHLKYGWVMFNRPPRRAIVWTFVAAGQTERRHLAAALETTSLTYMRARVSLQSEFNPDYPAELCARLASLRGAILTKSVYTIDDPLHPVRRESFRCERGKLRPNGRES
jgi:hypothetical protein